MKRTRAIIVVVLVLACFAFSKLAAKAGNVQLVKDGMAVSVIVLDKNAVRSAKFAAAELQYHLKLMTGTTIPIIDDDSSEKRTKIYVGESDATRKMGLKSADFEEQEYLVRVKDDYIVLIGHDSDDRGRFRYLLYRETPNKFSQIGTCYAVYDFLWALGFRWYLPTEIGIVYDEAKTVYAPAMDIQRKPYMVSRGGHELRIPDDFTGSATSPTREFLPGMDVRLFYMRLKAGGENENINHSVCTWYDRFADTHPEYFAQGQPLRQYSSQLCYTNPAVIAQTIQDARDYFDGDPDAHKKNSSIPNSPFRSNCYPVEPADNSRFCKCENCAKLMLPEPKRQSGGFRDTHSDYWFSFVNAVAKEVAKTHPDKTIGTLAYMTHAYPPENFRLEPNIKVRMALGARTWDPAETIPDTIKVWQEAYPEMTKSLHLWYLHPYYLLSRRGFESFPAFFADYIGEQFKVYINAGVNSFMYEPPMRSKGEAFLDNQLECFLTYRLADDPTLDAPKLIDEFFARYYGKAGDAMKKLYRGIQKASFDAAARNPVVTLEELQWGESGMGTRARMKEFAGYMEEAKKAVVGDREVYRKRVEIFEKGLWNKMTAAHTAFANRAAALSGTMKQVCAFQIVAPKDGDAKNVAWKQVTPLRDWRTRQGEKINRDISLKITHDGRNIYMLLEDTVETAKLTDLTTWGDGCEFFFGATRNFPYKYLAISHKGETNKLHFGELHERGEWNPKLTFHSDLSDPKCWRLYVTLPLDSIGLKPGQMLYFNASRGRNNSTEAFWIPTFGGNHEPSRFGEIWLEKR